MKQAGGSRDCRRRLARVDGIAASVAAAAAAAAAAASAAGSADFGVLHSRNLACAELAGAARRLPKFAPRATNNTIFLRAKLRATAP